MTEAEKWKLVKSWDEDGSATFTAIKDLVSGKLNEQEIDELTASLIREGAPSTAAYASVPYLLQDDLPLSDDDQYHVLAIAGLIIGLAEEEFSPSLPDFLELRITNQLKDEVFQRIIEAAAKTEFSSGRTVSLASILLLLKGRSDLYSSLLPSQITWPPKVSTSEMPFDWSLQMD